MTTSRICLSVIAVAVLLSGVTLFRERAWTAPDGYEAAIGLTFLSAEAGTEQSATVVESARRINTNVIVECGHQRCGPVRVVVGRCDPLFECLEPVLAAEGASDDGRVRFGLPRGTFAVCASSPFHSAGCVAHERTLEDEQEEVRVQLTRGGALSGTVVDAADGSPLAGVAVSVLSRDRSNSMAHRVMRLAGVTRVQTTSEGHFLVEGLAPGDALASFEMAGYGALKRPIELPIHEGLHVALARGCRLEGLVTQADGARTRADLIVESGESVQRWKVGPEGTFAFEIPCGPGRLSAEGEGGVALVPFDALSNGTSLFLRVNLGEGASITFEATSVAGAYGLERATFELHRKLANGQWTVDRRAGGSEMPFRNVLPGIFRGRAAAPGFAQKTSEEFILAGGENRQLRFELNPLLRIAGRVVSGTRRLEPVEGAFVRLNGPWGPLSAGAPTVRTDRDGRFEFREVEPGRNIVRAWRRGEALGVESQVALSKSELSEELELVLPGVGHLLGTVRAAGPGRLPPGVEVIATRTPARDAVRSMPVRVDESGRFELTVTEGTYRVSAAVRGSYEWNMLNHGELAVVTPGERTYVELVLPASRARQTVSGTVVGPDGHPHTSRVFVQGSRFFKEAITRPDGSFVASLDGWADEPVDVVAVAGGRLGRVRGLRAGDGNVVVRLVSGGAVDFILPPIPECSQREGCLLRISTQRSSSMVKDFLVEYLVSGTSLFVEELPAEALVAELRSRDRVLARGYVSPSRVARSTCVVAQESAAAAP